MKTKRFEVVFGGNEFDMPAEINLSEIETFEEFEAHLKKHRIRYNMDEGVFTKGYAWWIWDADDHDNSLGWLFMFLENLTLTYWDEMCENVFASTNCSLADAFDALKRLETKEFGLDEDGEPFTNDGEAYHLIEN